MALSSPGYLGPPTGTGGGPTGPPVQQPPGGRTFPPGSGPPYRIDPHHLPTPELQHIQDTIFGGGAASQGLHPNAVGPGVGVTLGGHPAVQAILGGNGDHTQTNMGPGPTPPPWWPPGAQWPPPPRITPGGGGTGAPPVYGGPSPAVNPFLSWLRQLYANAA